MSNKPWQEEALSLHKEGLSNRAIGRKLDKDESVIRRYLKRVNELASLPIGNPLQALDWSNIKPTDVQQRMLDEAIDIKVYGPAAGGGMSHLVYGALNYNHGEGVLFGGQGPGSKSAPMNIKPLDLQMFHVHKKKPLSIIVIADTQAKDGISLEYCRWIGEYIYDKQPDVVVHIGDHADCPSLSSYDKGKRSFEGRRLKLDIEAAKLGMDLIVGGFKKDGYNPRMVFCLGNHEERLDRLANDMPELSGFVGTELLNLEQYGWEVYPFLKPAVIENIFFVHFLANPFTGKPYGGTAMSQLKTVGNSFVVGHKQVLDVAIRPTLDGKHQIGIINGAGYDHYEPYKGHTGNNHFRGLTVLHEVEDGFGLPMFVSLDYLKRKYS